MVFILSSLSLLPGGIGYAAYAAPAVVAAPVVTRTVAVAAPVVSTYAVGHGIW